MTKAMKRFLEQVRDTGSTAAKWAVRQSAEDRGYIEQDRIEGNMILYRLTEAGNAALGR